MQTDILQAFLDIGLLDLGEGPEKKEFLKSAAADVTTALNENRALVIQGASVLVGGSVEPGDEVVLLCEEAIKRYWPTYRSRFSASTQQLYRATLLQALVDVTEGADCIDAAIVYYTASSALPHVGLERDDRLLTEFLRDLSEKVEKIAESSWAGPMVSLAELKHEGPASALGSFNAKTLTDALKAAAGPSAGAAGANPHWPSSNSQEWLDHYGKLSAQAIGSAFTAAQTASATALVAQARADDQIVLSRVRDAIGRSGADNFRLNLLFWKECLFSRSRDESYRAMRPDSAVFWMAHDLHQQVPMFHPRSVEFFLRETLRDAIGEQESKLVRPIPDFCSSLDLQGFADTSRLSRESSDRLTLLETAEATFAKELNGGDFERRTGILPSTAVPRDQLIVWLFRDFQARRLAEECE